MLYPIQIVVSVTVAPPWFTKHRGLAMGIITAGTGVGGVAWAPALQASIKALGFRNTLRWSGGVSFVLVAVASFAMAWEPVTKRQIEIENQTRQRRFTNFLKVPLVDWKVARSRKFAAQALAAVCQSAVYYIPVFFFAAYARTLGYSDTAGANFIAISNACNAVGKIAIGHFADRAGRLNMLFLTTFLSAIFTLSFWLPSTLGGVNSTSQGLFIAFAMLYGTFASAYIALFPTSLVELFGPQHFASVNGVLYMLRGFSTMIGTPVGGVLTRSSAGDIGPRAYLNMSVLVGVLLFATTGACVWVRLEAAVGQAGQTGRKWRM